MTTRDEVGRCSHLSKGIELSRHEIFQAGRERERERARDGNEVPPPV
jgi:hypothetical protein